MPTVTIKEARIDSVVLERKEDGDYGLSGQYSLVTTADKVLATQPFGGFNKLQIPMSPATSQAYAAFIAAYQGDVNALLGFA